jgi:hypothetical protein
MADLGDFVQGAIAAVSVLVAIAWALPVPQAASATPSVVIHLRITGGYGFTGMLSAHEDYRSGNACDVSRVSTGKMYAVTYGVDRQFLLGRPRHNGFMMQIQGYNAKTNRYSSTRDTLIVVVRQHSYYTEGILRLPSKLTVHMDRNQRSGTFDAAKLAPTPGLRSKPVHIQGSWRCSFVRHG